MGVEPARPKQKTSMLAPRLMALLVLVVVITLIAVGVVLAGPAYAGHAELYTV